MTNLSLYDQLKRNFSLVVPTIAMRDNKYKISEVVTDNKDELMDSLFKLAQDVDKTVSWKAYWILIYMKDQKYFERLLSFFFTRFHIEKDLFVKAILAYGIENFSTQGYRFMKDEERSELWSKHKSDLELISRFDYTKISSCDKRIFNTDWGTVYYFIHYSSEFFDELVRAINHPLEKIRISAIVALGTIADKRATPILKELLNDSTYENQQIEINYQLSLLEPENRIWGSRVLELGDKGKAITEYQQLAVNNIRFLKTFRA
ncbi:MAG: HEAT repeat domain-containing protein [Candidatus Heimdallarchaeota archaeon]|nr:HEAT repeat domain-containing protein [Candidatus Heimdallarchaeota archaeon]